MSDAGYTKTMLVTDIDAERCGVCGLRHLALGDYPPEALERARQIHTIYQAESVNMELTSTNGSTITFRRAPLWQRVLNRLFSIRFRGCRQEITGERVAAVYRRGMWERP